LDGTNRMSIHLDMNLTDIAFSNYHFDRIHTNHGKWLYDLNVDNSAYNNTAENLYLLLFVKNSV